MNKDLEILRKGNSELRQELEKVKKERDKVCEDYIKLYKKLEDVKDLVKEKIKREKLKILNSNNNYISLEMLGDFQELLYILERKD